MKLLKILLLSCAPMVLFSCSKDKTTPDNTNSSNTVAGYALDNSFHVSNGGVLAVQPDGKIINALSGVINVNANATIQRLNKDGSIDNSFTLGSGLFASPNYTFTCIAVQANGKILVGFTMTSPNAAGVGILRLNSDGSKDNSFTVPAITRYSSNSFTPIYAIVPLSDGSAYIGGSFNNVPYNSHLAKISASGTIDNSFICPIVAGSQVSSLALQPDGKLVATGNIQAKINGQNRNFLIRMDGSGTVDAGFNQTLGFYNVVAANPYATYPSKAQLQPNGKLLVSGLFGSIGTSSSTAAIYPGLARFNTDGSLDASFQPESGGAIYPVTDDRILIGKTAVSLSSPPKDFFTALDGSGKASAAFNSLGLTEASVNEIVKLSETEYLLSGYFNNGSTTYSIIKVKKQ